MASETSRSRITVEQRRLMVEFVKLHKGVLTGRFAGPDSARQKNKILSQMANILNSTGFGAVKTPEKWLRSFQDWKSDVKKKAAKIAAHSRGTGGGPPMSELSDVERDLVDLIGESAVSGHAEVADPLEGPLSLESEPPESEDPAVPEMSEEPGPSASQQEQAEPQRKKRRRDEDVDHRMVAAMERQADAVAEIGQQIGRLTDVCIMFFNWWTQQTTEL